MILRRVLSLAYLTALVLSALFIAATSHAQTASFVKSDSVTTPINAPVVYGAGGYAIAQQSFSLPSYASKMTNSSGLTWSWPGVATCWFGSPSDTISPNFTDTAVHQVALYVLDGDKQGRSETLQVVTSAGAVLDTETATAAQMQGGVFFVWNVSGNVGFRATALAGPNAVITGIYFGTAAASTGGGTTTTVPTIHTFSLTWAASANAVSYNVYLNGAKITSVTALAYSGTVNVGTSYTFTVTSVDSSGNESSPASVTGVTFKLTS